MRVVQGLQVYLTKLEKCTSEAETCGQGITPVNAFRQYCFHEIVVVELETNTARTF